MGSQDEIRRVLTASTPQERLRGLVFVLSALKSIGFAELRRRKRGLCWRTALQNHYKGGAG